QTAPAPAKPKVRAITAFIAIDRSNYQQRVDDAVAMLKRAKAAFEKEGYEVQTVRITTQPFPDYVRGLSRADALAFLKQFDDTIAAQPQRAGIAVDANLGPAMLHDKDDPAMADLLAEALCATKIVNAS